MNHHLRVDSKLETVESRYLTGTREVTSEDWNKANRAYEKAEMDLATAQASLQGAQAKSNKRQVQDLSASRCGGGEERGSRPCGAGCNAEDGNGKHHQALHLHQEDGHVDGFHCDAVQGFRFLWQPAHGSDQHGGTEEVQVLENVKPEDTTGTKEIGAEVDQAEFLTAVENDASASLVAAVRQSVEQLPHKIYENARDPEAEQDLDGAGEAYLRFLEAFC